MGWEIKILDFLRLGMGWEIKIIDFLRLGMGWEIKIIDFLRLGMGWEIKNIEVPFHVQATSQHNWLLYIYKAFAFVLSYEKPCKESLTKPLK